MIIRTWRYEATVQAALYLGAIYAQQGTVTHPSAALASALWLLGRVTSRADRQREAYEEHGVVTLMEHHAVECAAGTQWDLRLVSILFGMWGLLIGSWLTLADVAWTVLYPFWRRLYRTYIRHSWMGHGN